MSTNYRCTGCGRFAFWMGKVLDLDTGHCTRCGDNVALTLGRSRD